MQLTEEHRVWVESLKVGDPVQVGVVSGTATTYAFDFHPEFMRAEVASVSPGEIEVKSLQNGKTHKFTDRGIHKEMNTMFLWEEGMEP